MIEDARKAKTEKYLNSQIRYCNNVVTVKHWLDELKNEGFIPCVESVHDTAKEEKETERLRLIISSWGFPLGNPQHPEYIQYYADKAKLESGIFKTVYLMRGDKLSYSITKTAYDYLAG